MYKHTPKGTKESKSIIHLTDLNTATTTTRIQWQTKFRVISDNNGYLFVFDNEKLQYKYKVDTVTLIGIFPYQDFLITIHQNCNLKIWKLNYSDDSLVLIKSKSFGKMPHDFVPKCISAIIIPSNNLGTISIATLITPEIKHRSIQILVFNITNENNVLDLKMHAQKKYLGISPLQLLADPEGKTFLFGEISPAEENLDCRTDENYNEKFRIQVFSKMYKRDPYSCRKSCNFIDLFSSLSIDNQQYQQYQKIVCPINFDTPANQGIYEMNVNKIEYSSTTKQQYSFIRTVCPLTASLCIWVQMFKNKIFLIAQAKGQAAEPPLDLQWDCSNNSIAPIFKCRPHSKEFLIAQDQTLRIYSYGIDNDILEFIILQNEIKTEEPIAKIDFTVDENLEIGFGNNKFMLINFDKNNFLETKNEIGYRNKNSFSNS